MRFTRSNDGVDRCTVRVKLRLTREQWATLQRMASETESTPHDIVAGNASLAVESEIWEAAYRHQHCSDDF